MNNFEMKHTCSVPSSFRASFTFPMLPAPIVLPSIHLPDWVGIVVRDLLVCFVFAARPSFAAAAGCEAGTGPPLWATVVVPTMSGRRGEGGGIAEDLEALRRWDREEGSALLERCEFEVPAVDEGRSLLELRLESERW